MLETPSQLQGYRKKVIYINPVDRHATWEKLGGLIFFGKAEYYINVAQWENIYRKIISLKTRDIVNKEEENINEHKDMKNVHVNDTFPLAQMNSTIYQNFPSWGMKSAYGGTTLIATFLKGYKVGKQKKTKWKKYEQIICTEPQKKVKRELLRKSLRWKNNHWKQKQIDKKLLKNNG